MNSDHNTVEILAPGGDSEAIKAAIIAGADAVYCGSTAFNARKRATNLTTEALKDLIKLAHQNNCKIYLTLNVLITDSEFGEVTELINKVREIGADAVIVQDPGLLLFIERYFPDLEVHASTQMTTHNRGQIEFLSNFPVSQVNLARELSLPEISELTEIAHHSKIKTEVFVHGAYCISFSGQCYMSSAMCGQSGNRGACVQPCRRLYTTENSRRAIAPMNLKDNSAFSHADALLSAGVDSLKIEGRIKNHLYVYTTVKAWKKQVNQWFNTSHIKPEAPELSQVFNRKFSAGYLNGKVDREMFIDTSRDQSLEEITTISGYSANRKILHLDERVKLKPGKEVIIYKPDFTFVCRGTVGNNAGSSDYHFTIEHKLMDHIKKGDILYGLADLNNSDELKKQLETIKPASIPLKINLEGRENSKLTISFRFNDKIVTTESEIHLEKAKSRGIDEKSITEQLGKLGNTDFVLESIDFTDLQKDLFIPRSVIGNLKQDFLSKTTIETEPLEVNYNPWKPLNEKPFAAFIIDSPEDVDFAQFPDSRFILELPLDLERKKAEYMGIFRNNPALIPWFQPILIGKHYEEALRFLKDLRPELIISDNSGIGFEAGKAGIKWIAGEQLNITNSMGVRSFSEKGHCSGAFISGELSREQIASITPPKGCGLWYKVLSPLLLMNTRQCLIRNSEGCSKDSMDDSCIPSCSRRTIIYDERKKPFYIYKRPGYFNQVYNGIHMFNPSIVEDLGNRFTCFTADLRNIETETERIDLRKFTGLFERMVAGDQQARKTLDSMLRKVTRAQYTRGLK